MNDFMIMQVAMEASAMPPPASTAGSEDTNISGDDSFDSKLEKAMNTKPDDEALALATEAVAVLMQAPVNQPVNDGKAVETSEEDTLTVAQKLVALIEGQTQQVQPEILAVVGNESGDGEAEEAAQGTQAVFTEALANEKTQGAVASETPVVADANTLELAAELAVKAGAPQTKKAAAGSTSGAETAKTAQPNAGEQATENPVIDLVNALKTGSNGKAQAPVEVAKGNNDPSQPDTTDSASTSKQSVKTTSEANLGDVKIEVAKVANSGKQVADTTTTQTSSNSGEVAKPLVDETATTMQAAVSESRKVKTNLGKMEGDSPPQISTAGKAIQAQELDAQIKEPARLAEARLPEMISQVSKGIDLLSRADGQSLRIQLQPENMGKIEIRLSSGSDGITVTLNADTQLTGNLLERSLSELRTSLADAGVNLASLSVNSGNKQSTYQESKQWFSGKENRTVYGQENNSINEELSSVNPLHKDSAIDYRI